MIDSLNGSELKASPRLSSASISFSTNGTFPMDYSSEIDENDDANSLLQLPISPVSQPEEEEGDNEDDNDEQEERSISLLEADTTTLLAEVGEVETSDSILPSVPNELSISTSQTSHCNEKNSNGQSPLSISSSNCFLDGMQLLVERGANINLQDAFGRSPLHLVIENADSDKHHESIDYLLQNGANPCVQDLQGRTPLHIAASVGCVECINKLMEHKADPNVKDQSGEIPLHIATKMMQLDCMEALSPSCEDSTSSVDSASSILQFENESSFYHLAGDRMTRSMQEMTVAASTTTITGKESWHDSGYFTARGNAWTKSKYYSSNRIEEEIESSQSTLRSESEDSLSQQAYAVNNTGGELSNTRRDTAIEFMLRIALYLIDLFLSILRNHIAIKSPPMAKGSPEQQEESCLSFKEPPAHIKEAMDRFKQQQRI